MLTHQGNAFMIPKVKESIDDSGFTLSVRDMNGEIDVETGYDSQWIAIGK